MARLTIHECPHGRTLLPDDDFPSGNVRCLECGPQSVPGVPAVALADGDWETVLQALDIIADERMHGEDEAAVATRIREQLA